MQNNLPLYLQNIPKHWEVKKVSWAFNTIGSGTTPNTNSEKYYENGTINWINTGDLNDGILYDCTKKITELAFQDHSTLKMYPENTLLIALYGATIGKVSLLAFEACTNQACCALANSDLFDMKYVFYWFLANREHIINQSYGGGQPNISQEIIKNLRIICPPLPEQHAIADYLDRKTAEIDGLINKKTQLIALLKEEEKAFINERLEIKDKRLEMRDERLEIKDKRLEIRDGEWQRKKLKYVCKFEYGNSLSTEERIEGEIDVFGSNGAVGTHNEAITNAPCIIIGRKGSFGKVNWSDKPCFPIDTTYFIDNTKTNENLKWLYYALQSLNLDSFSRDTGVPGLNREDAYSNFINVPSLPTQARIVGEIEAHLGKSRAIGEKLQREIGLLKEYRQSLISEAVTGRVRV